MKSENAIDAQKKERGVFAKGEQVYRVKPGLYNK